MARIWCSNIINTMTIFGVQMGSPFHSAGADDFVFWFFFFTQNRQFCNLGKYELLSVLLPSFGCKVKVAQSCPTLRPHGLCPWNSPGQSTGEGSLSLCQGIFPPKGSNPGLPHCRRILTERPFFKWPQITNAGEGVEKREPPYTVGGTATMEKLHGGSLEN